MNLPEKINVKIGGWSKSTLDASRKNLEKEKDFLQDGCHILILQLLKLLLELVLILLLLILFVFLNLTLTICFIASLLREEFEDK